MRFRCSNYSDFTSGEAWDDVPQADILQCLIRMIGILRAVIKNSVTRIGREIARRYRPRFYIGERLIMQKIRTIAVLTSGGDAPGMNAAIRAVVHSGLKKGIRVLGIRHGYEGLLTRDIFEMHQNDVSDCLYKGGTILHTSRCDAFKTASGLQKARETCLEFGIDGIVIIGGDGSFRGAQALSEMNVRCIGIPGTIDNDIASTDYTIGFDTSVNTVANMIEKIEDSAASHDCCTVVEVMGRRCGDIAIHAGLACGAVAILIPEAPFSLENISQKMRDSLQKGQHHFIIVIAEGVIQEGLLESTQSLANSLETLTGIKTRVSNLGFVQRGGDPTVQDRILASEMGVRAVELLEQGAGNLVVCTQRGQIIEMEICKALQMPPKCKNALYDIAELITF